MSPVLKHCHRHRALSSGRCPACVSEQNARRRLHSDRRNRPFRIGILERDNYTCHWCGKYGDTLDYLVPLAVGGRALEETNAVCACLSCNSRRGAELVNKGGVSPVREEAKNIAPLFRE